MIEKRLRKILYTFRTTPLHPQWFSFRDETRLLSFMGEKATGVVLDIGCGTRRLEHFVSPENNYIGVDYEPTSRMYGSRPDLYADAQKLPFPDQTANTVAMLEVLEHIPNPLSALKEAARILKYDGELLLSLPFLYPIHDAPHDYHRWTEYGIRWSAASVGLSVTHIESRGTPLESAVLNLNIALSRFTLRLIQKINPVAILLLILTPPLVLSFNLFAALARLADRSDGIMPFGYMAVFRKGHADKAPKTIHVIERA